MEREGRRGNCVVVNFPLKIPCARYKTKLRFSSVVCSRYKHRCKPERCVKQTDLTTVCVSPSFIVNLLDILNRYKVVCCLLQKIYR